MSTIWSEAGSKSSPRQGDPGARAPNLKFHRKNEIRKMKTFLRKMWIFYCPLSPQKLGSGYGPGLYAGYSELWSYPVQSKIIMIYPRPKLRLKPNPRHKNRLMLRPRHKPKLENHTYFRPPDQTGPNTTPFQIKTGQLRYNYTLSTQGVKC